MPKLNFENVIIFVVLVLVLTALLILGIAYLSGAWTQVG